MPSLRDIRHRIKSVSSTEQITRAMQMVAASKMRKAQQAALTTRPFGRLLYRLQRRAITHARDFEHPLLAVREVRKRAVVLVATDKGLCGALNANLFHTAAQFDPATTVYIAVGKRAAQFIARSGRKLAAEFSFPDSARFAEARSIAVLARDMFLKGEVDRVEIVATRFVNTMVQRPYVVKFLPIGEIDLKALDAEADVEGLDGSREIVFEPSPEAVLSYLLGHYLNIFLDRVLLEAKASEQSARMVAMTNASDSASKLIRDLTLEYNKLRQGSITNEILEIAGGQLNND
jgi:F-type H+-transporting ATPase subunit gamma